MATSSEKAAKNIIDELVAKHGRLPSTDEENPSRNENTPFAYGVDGITFYGFSGPLNIETNIPIPDGIGRAGQFTVDLNAAFGKAKRAIAKKEGSKPQLATDLSLKVPQVDPPVKKPRRRSRAKSKDLEDTSPAKTRPRTTNQNSGGHCNIESAIRGFNRDIGAFTHPLKAIPTATINDLCDHIKYGGSKRPGDKGRLSHTSRLSGLSGTVYVAYYDGDSPDVCWNFIDDRARNVSAITDPGRPVSCVNLADGNIYTVNTSFVTGSQGKTSRDCTERRIGKDVMTVCRGPG
jgi:hypothetical protein